MSSGEVKWKHFEEGEMPRACKAIVIMIIVLIFVGCIIGLIVWDGMGENNEPVNTIDDFTFSQRLAAQQGESVQDNVKTEDGSIIGGIRQLFVSPPTTDPSQVIINRGGLYYEYKGDGANGFEVRWLDYITEDKPDIESIDLSDVKSFDVDVKSLKLSPGATFTMQMNVKDLEGVESSVVSVVDSLKTVKFDSSSFIGNEPGQRPDFSKISGMWLGGDFRSGGGDITMGNLKLDKVPGTNTQGM